jgi:hypothetical protein
MKQLEEDDTIQFDTIIQHDTRRLDTIPKKSTQNTIPEEADV